MNVRSLSFNDDPGRKAVLYGCGKCGKLYSPKICGADRAIEAAERCCDPKEWTCNVCGVEVGKYKTMCAQHAERDKLLNAVQIDKRDWNDPVFLDGAPGGWGDGYFEDVRDLEDAWIDHNFEGEPPAYCWPCAPIPLKIDPQTILENATDDMHETAFDEIVDGDGLKNFIEKWNAKQTCVSWHPDYSRIVVLDSEKLDAILSR